MGCIPYTKNSLSIAKIEDPENNNKEKRTGDNQEEHNVIQISSSKYPQSTSYQNKDSNIIILKPMPRQSELSQKFDSIESDKKIIRSSSSNKFENENNKLSNVIKVKKKINSSMNLLKNLEVNNLDSQKALPSLNKQSQLNNNNMIEILPCFEETMYDVWIEKDKEIKIVIIGNWGIEEKGSTNENGYDGLVNGYNLCSLLYRIGTDTQYQKLTHKDEQARYILKSDIEGPLFFKMNINKEVILNNRFTLFGKLNVDILNVNQIQRFDLFQKMGWKESFLKQIFENSMYQSLSEDESLLLFYLNLLRSKPVLFIDYFFLGNSELKNELFNLNSIQDILHYSENLKNVIGNKSDTNYETRKKSFFSQFPNTPVEELTVKTFTNSEIEIINTIINSGNYQWIFDNHFNAIGIVITSNLDEDPNTNFTCDLLLTSSN